MTSPSQPDPARRRLGDLLLQRRVDIDARYANRRAFCTEAQVDYRVVSDIESARRDNFSQPVIVQLENAYRLKRGNIERILKGGGLEPQQPIAHVAQVSLETSAPEERQAGFDVVTNPDLDIHVVGEKLGGFRHGRQGEEERRIAAMTASPWYDRVAAIEMLRRVFDAQEQQGDRSTRMEERQHGG